MSQRIIEKLSEMAAKPAFIDYSELLELVGELPPPVLQGKTLTPIDEEFLLLNADFLVKQVQRLGDDNM